MTGTEPATRPAESAAAGRTALGRTFVPRPPEPLFSKRLPNGDPFDPRKHGLDADLTTGAYDKHGYTEIDHAAWLRSLAMGGVVGSCRRCGAFLVAESPRQHDGGFEYTAHCRRPMVGTFVAETQTRTVDGCGWELVAPNGRVLLGSSSQSERRLAVSKRRNGVRNGATDGVT